MAVTNTDGPLLIIAGAGTGKTRVIISRILHLLLDKKVPSKNILALTFTEKAANEMIERVDMAMPLSYEEVTIKTFHGLCDQILRERGLEIGIDPGFKILSQTEQWIFLKKNIFKLELDYYRPLGNPNKFIHTLINYFSRLKDEDISPDAYLKYAQDSKDEESEKYLELAKTYKSYQDLKIENNYLDFGDLQYYALRLLEKRPSVLKEYRERFQYVLVDEYQDTNFAQNKLVLMLTEKHRNLTVVGDDDQSIYKWRGASLTNILGFKKVFPEAKEVVLTENYRSSQNILDVSYSLIQNNNPHRLEAEGNIDKKLVSSSGGEEPVVVSHFSSYLEETKRIVGKINELKNGNYCNYSDFAILVRANQHANPFIEALKEAEIPFAVRDTQGLLKYEEIKDLVALLKFLVMPHSDIAFFRLLSLPIFNVPMSSILDLVQKAKKDSYTPLFFYFKKILQEANQPELPGISGISEETENFRNIYDIFDTLLDFTKRNSVSRTLGEFLDKSGYLKALTDEENEINTDKIQHIAAFLEISRDFEADTEDNAVRSFLDYLESLREANGVISSLPSIESDAVSILTVHSSKGLEFDHVFMPTLVANRFPSTSRKDPIDIPEELIAEDLPREELHLNEERRLFYVACTRAKKQLFLSYSDYYEGRRHWKISQFINEIIENKNVVEKDFTETTKDEVSKQDLETRSHAGIKLPEKSEHGNKLMHIPEVKVNRLSYSKIDTFKTCPLKYKFRYLFQIPSPSAHAANFGASVHDTINKFYEQVRDSADPTLELLKELFEKNWICSGYDNKGHEQARKKHGLEIMDLFFKNEEKSGFKVPAFLERPFHLKIGDISFTGRIDRIDKLGDGTYEVIDYKTGKSKRDAKLNKDLQLSLYALACRDIFRIPVSKLTLYFLEDGQRNSIEAKELDLEQLKEVLKGTVDELKESQFAPTPGFLCGFCEYRILCNAAQ